MRIGILTLFHENYNWGGVLQGYALKTLIESTFPDAQADLLIYRGSNIVYSSKFFQALQYSPVDIIRKASKLIRKPNNDFRDMLEPRFALFRSFTKEHTTNTKVYTDENLIEAAQEYDCLISGSDQVWNPNVGWAGFFQKNISDECRKIAYAASIARDDLSNHERKIMIPLIERFHAVSVREKTAKDIVEKYSTSDLQITEVLDPAMMISQEEWSKVAEKSTRQYSGRYALAFFFSESASYRNKITEYCKENHLDLKFIPYARGEYISSDDMGEAERLFAVGPHEFLKLYQNAQCVFTDSFHGCVFSIIFQKPFCVFERDKKSKVSKNSRLYDLLNKFQLSSRMIHDVAALNEVMRQPLDFTEICKLHERYKKESLDFLCTELNKCNIKERCKISHVGEMAKQMCSGCELCAFQCPRNCIQMCQDEEGFYFPVVDSTACVNCGQCLSVCNKKAKQSDSAACDTYIGYHKNEAIRAGSSSGGIFHALANTVLQVGGCVYGAAYDADFSVRHHRITAREELPLLMTSKYVQSRMENVFAQVLDDLKNGCRVLFSGTPCQVAAMRAFVDKHNLQENLLLVDFICHGVPSPGVWQSYLHYLQTALNASVKNISFRDKSKGWHDYCFKAEGSGIPFAESHEMNAYLRTFLSDKNLRKSCYVCQYKNNNFFSDITLGDAWKIEKDCLDWADDKGTSLFMVRTEKGYDLLKAVGNQINCRRADYNKWKEYNPSLIASTTMPVGRGAFFADYFTMSNQQFWKNAKRIPVKKVARYALKRIVRFLGIEKVLRKHISN